MNKYNRIIDVNINRFAEALRVIEDVARFVIEDPKLSSILKNWRHQIRKLYAAYCLDDRNSEDDFGRSLHSSGEMHRNDIADLITAAFKRIQESLRVLEEVCKVTDKDAAINFKQMRFDAYSLEKDICQKLKPFLRKTLPDKLLYLVLSLEHCGDRNPARIAEEALKGGVKAIQLRDKNRLKDKELLNLGATIKDLCHKYDALFIVNDRADIASILNADGLHLGQEDISPKDARKIVGPDMLIGCSCHNINQLSNVDKDVVDYVAIGPIYSTNTKDNPAPTVGPNVFLEIKDYKLPIVAIGGIKPDNLKEIVSLGCRRIAAVTGIMRAGDIVGEAQKYLEIIGRCE